MLSLDTFLASLPPAQNAVVSHLLESLTTYPGVEIKMRYGIPFLYRKSWICYLNPLKKGGVELVFIRGVALSNQNGLLEAKGRKMVAGRTYPDLQSIDEDLLWEVFNEALLLDDAHVKKSR
jgi:hypothetical protein